MKPTVVIAEQSAIIARQLASAFEHAGYAVVAICGDGMSALEQVKLHKPTVVTMDILLPRLGGLQLASAIRRADVGSKVYFITAVANRERVEAARMLGANYYALKPVNMEKLVAAARASAGTEDSHASAV